MTDKILCNECQNAEICKYREEYGQVHADMTRAQMYKTLDDGRHSIRNVSDVPYVEVIVDCKYFRRKNGVLL